jgi:hypothetical protein
MSQLPSVVIFNSSAGDLILFNAKLINDATPHKDKQLRLSLDTRIVIPHSPPVGAQPEARGEQKEEEKKKEEGGDEDVAIAEAVWQQCFRLHGQYRRGPALQRAPGVQPNPGGRAW